MSACWHPRKRTVNVSATDAAPWVLPSSGPLLAARFALIAALAVCLASGSAVALSCCSFVLALLPAVSHMRHYIPQPSLHTLMATAWSDAHGRLIHHRRL